MGIDSTIGTNGIEPHNPIGVRLPCVGQPGMTLPAKVVI